MKSWHVIEARRYVIEKNVCYLFILLHNLPFKIHFSITRHLILCLPNNTFSRVFNKNCIPIIYCKTERNVQFIVGQAFLLLCHNSVLNSPLQKERTRLLHVDVL